MHVLGGNPERYTLSLTMLQGLPEGGDNGKENNSYNQEIDARERRKRKYYRKDKPSTDDSFGSYGPYSGI